MRLFSRDPVVPVVPLRGPIGIGAPFRQALGLAEIDRALSRAFAMRRAPAVALAVNSPGGAPVQAHLIHRRIRGLAERHGRPVLAFVEDAAASGGYWLACAGDEIFADPASLVGSIGVTSQGFGFVGLIERLGIERRVHTSGENKDFLDPFQAEKPEDVTHLERIQREVHAHFADLVRARRGAKLSGDPEIFSGQVWTGTAATELGLVDGIGALHDVLRARFGEKTSIQTIEPRGGSLLRRLFARPASAAAEGALGAVEERLLWGRLGL